ncbi:nitroreductase [Methylobacterium aquaticum]|jgi:nitroreductase|uniref:Nitrobenzoate reductase n=1 Tax=Methylobacterium aquaticum TaxID=270351 RepID=A0A0J6SG74_9HYPH|nr:nitroreductase [Methylobacterium aquaticum]KMO32363.1 nitrobenzoate reductase [Methylobacterium aquaticum]
MEDSGTIRAIDGVIRARRSVRAFLKRSVPTALVREILEVAARAPSGVNTQPWKVHVLTGPALKGLSDAIVAAFDRPDPGDPHVAEFTSYPDQWLSPYQERRRKLGWDLYGLLGIAKGDATRMHAQIRRNYEFFDAPVGLIFVIDRVMAKGSMLDYGMFMQNVMLAAKARGLDTCPQAAFATYHRVITRQLGIPPEQVVVCGMSLGYADGDAVENTLKTHRETVDSFAVFHGG